MVDDLDPTQGIAVYTDGSAYTADRSGGWAWVALDAYQGLATDSGHWSQTTINQMELMAPTHALTNLYQAFGSIEVLIYSDSQYVVMGCTDRTRKRNVNLDWWANMDSAVDLHDYVQFEHVRGHSKVKYNEMADKLAGDARREGVANDQ